jgi:NIMA (never in mitosis gene a)-related kinase
MAAGEARSREWTAGDYTVEKSISDSCCVHVLLCKEKATGRPLVVKQVSLANLAPKEQHDNFQRKTAFLSQLHHENIVGYLGSFLEGGFFHKVMEFVDGGDLADRISAAGTVPFPEDQICNWFAHVCSAIKHLHDRQLTYGNGMPGNILIAKSGLVKLGGFRVERTSEHADRRPEIPTIRHYSPEICQGKPHGITSDIWGLGCLLYEMCTFKPPFMAVTLGGLVLKIMRGKLEPIPAQYSQSLQVLITRLLEKNPDKRPSVNEILGMDFIAARSGQMVEK